MIAQVPEAASNSKAIIEELNDQVGSYLGLLDEKDDEIKRVRTYVKQRVVVGQPVSSYVNVRSYVRTYVADRNTHSGPRSQH